MAQHFCNTCGIELGYKIFVDPNNNFTGSVGDYKFNKYRKHTTQPGSSSNIVSFFNNTDYDTYKSYILDAANSGSVEIDDLNRINLIWIANKNIGQSFEAGKFNQSTDSVKLVLHDNDQKIHAFPTSSYGLNKTFCNHCGNPLII